MLHAIGLKNGELFYCNRYTQTNKYIREKEAGRKIFASFGDLTEIGILLAPLSELMTTVGYLDNAPQFHRATANTALVQHAQRTYALLEVDFPFQVKVVQEDHELDIASLGYDDINGQLKHACSAHPKVDARTQEFFVFAYSIKEPVSYYTVFDGKRKLQRNFSVPMLNARMVHDFLITEKYAIIPDLPIEFDPKKAIKENTFAFTYNK